MKMFAVLAIFLPLVLCADPDPTKVCLPDQVQFTMYDMNAEMTSTVAIDFAKKRLGSVNNFTTAVQDLGNAMSYITDAMGTCNSYPIPKDDLVFQCLPADATYFGNSTIGFGSNSMQEHGWEVALGGGKRLRYVLSTDTATMLSYPVLSQIRDGTSVTSYFYINPTNSITANGIFDIPSPCPPKTTV